MKNKPATLFVPFGTMLSEISPSPSGRHTVKVFRCFTPLGATGTSTGTKLALMIIDTVLYHKEYC